MLSILPKFKEQEHKAELVFVIDRSSSMNSAGIQQAKRALLVKVVTKFYLFWIFILNSFFFISCSFIRFGLIAMSTSLDMALSTMFSFPEPAESMMMTFWSSFKNTLQVIQFLKVVSTPFLFSLFTFISNGSRFGRIGNYWTSPSCLEATNYRWLPASSFRHHCRRGKTNQNSSVKLFYIYLIHQIIQVSNKDDLIPLVQQLAGKARVFALGI